jgi:deoxyribonuclease-2
MKLSPMDDSGNAIDMWFAYKVPKLTRDGATSSTSGYEYMYYDPSVARLQQSPSKMNEGKGALAFTLDSLFKAPDPSTGWILYNDERPPVAPGKDDGSLGHTKGVLAFDQATETAFWLLHSWPKFAAPNLPAMPTPLYGQTFLCLSLTISTARSIAAQMLSHQEPQVFGTRLPAGLDKDDPFLRLSQPIKANDPADSSVVDGATRGGLPFKVIAKNRKWGKDFWNDLVGPTLKVDLDVETWIRGAIPPTLDSDGIHKTFDVKFIDLSRLGAPWAWPESKDHAKWGLSVDSDWVCVGDINRMISQEARGGGTIAFQDDKLWGALAKTDLVVAPPGHSRTEARKLIRATHNGNGHH